MGRNKVNSKLGLFFTTFLTVAIIIISGYKITTIFTKNLTNFSKYEVYNSF